MFEARKEILWQLSEGFLHSIMRLSRTLFSLSYLLKTDAEKRILNTVSKTLFCWVYFFLHQSLSLQFFQGFYEIFHNLQMNWICKKTWLIKMYFISLILTTFYWKKKRENGEMDLDCIACNWQNHEIILKLLWPRLTAISWKMVALLVHFFSTMKQEKRNVMWKLQVQQSSPIFTFTCQDL